MPHICHITTSHNSTDIRIFQRECCGLANNGFKITLIARHPCDETINGVNILSLPHKGRIYRKTLLPKIALQKAIPLNADIYHFHDPELLPFMYNLSKNTSYPVIWDVHELYSGTLKEFTLKTIPVSGTLVAKSFDYYEFKWCKHFAGIIGVTEPLTARYSLVGCPRITIKNVIDLDHVPPISLKKNTGIFSIIASGTANESRCIKELIEAFAIITEYKPNCILQLVAKFDSHTDKNNIKRLIAKKGLAGRVKIKPLVPWEQLMSREIPYADLGVVLYASTPNNLVGLPNRLFEYWACKLPVVATNTPLLKEILSENNAGLLVNSLSPNEIAGAIRYYIDNPDKAKKDGEKGYQSVIEKYSWKYELKKLCQFYEDILKRKSPIPAC